MSPTSDGQEKWVGTRPEEIKVYITRTIGKKGHTIEQYRVLKDHLEQLVNARHLKEFIIGHEGGNVGQGSGSRNDRAFPPPLGVIEVICATTWSVSLNNRKGVLSVIQSFESETVD